MNYFKLERKVSPIAGEGLFAGELIPKGRMVINWLDADTTFVREEEHLKMISDPIINKSSIRLIGDIFILGDVLGETDYINHSDTPNLVYFQGLCFSGRDIPVGEELTLDYRFLNAESQEDVVLGYSAKKALLESTQKMVELFGMK